MNILIDGQTLHTPDIYRGIGTYFINIVEELLKNDFTNTFYISIDKRDKLNHLSKYSQDKLIPIYHAYFNPTSLYHLDPNEGNNQYNSIIYKNIVDNKIDLYWSPNPLMTNVFLPEKFDKVYSTATIYDLIPVVMKDAYLSKWENRVAKLYLAKLEILKKYTLLYPISSTTKQDTLRILSIEENKQIITSVGVSEKFKPYPFPNVSRHEKYILYLGGMDPRKNMFKAIEAFAIFLKKYNESNEDYKLYIVCQLDEDAKIKLIKHIKAFDLNQKVKLTGYIEEEELIKIYQKAVCFFFPSLYEGFGLPVLEALASGLPVACSNNSSLSEVAGSYATYFDSDDVNDMAKALLKKIKEPNSLKERRERYNYSSKFTWERSARIILSSFKKIKIKHNSLNKIKNIAWVSPFPPQKTGIANYSKSLCFAMSELVHLDLYYDKVIPDQDLRNKFQIYPINDLKNKFNQYDEVIYHIGNNSSFHKNIYKYAWDYPATVVLHDWNIHPFMQSSFLWTKDSYLYENALLSYGEIGIQELTLIKKKNNVDVFKFPMSDSIVNRSKKVIVHSQWVKRQFATKNIEVIPLFSDIQAIPSPNEIKEFKRILDVSHNEYLITCLGDINLNKLPDIQIEATKRLIDNGYPVKLIFAGKIQPETKFLFERLQGSHYANKIIVTDYLFYNKYISCLFASDVVINLRFPSMGESSATLAETLFAGKPTIIGDYNQYKEYPDDILGGKIKYNGDEIAQLVNIIKYLLENKNYRCKIAKQAKNYVEETLNINKVIKLYV